ncbi:MAG TPA: TolC family protein [Bryobacteraceae bacterium]|nr:TolC family protein [Bryobacteraceae bacterium]
MLWRRMECNFHLPPVRTFLRRLALSAGIAACGATAALAQKTLTWDDAKRELLAANPTLLAGRIGIQESRAQEITASLRPNPDLTLALDQVDPFTTNPYRPFSGALPFVSTSYLVERQHKRRLRVESAQKATTVALSELADEQRTLVFGLRGAFIQVLQQKAVLAVARESLGYYDRLLAVNRDRYKVGDIAAVDLDRLELQRVQFETDVQVAIVNVRTAKIQLKALLNDSTPVERLDVSGPFEFADILTPLEEFRQYALDSRPDLRAALQGIDKARTDYRLAVANGSTDPVFGLDFGHQYPVQAFVGVSVSIPLRIFDRNQGEKTRTRLDIDRSQRLADAIRLQVFSDVDSAYAAIESNLILLRPYQTNYLPKAARVRETIAFSYQHGGASLVDFLESQQAYREIQLAYVNLVGSYLTAASQLNFAVGREVVP